MRGFLRRGTAVLSFGVVACISPPTPETRETTASSPSAEASGAERQGKADRLVEAELKSDLGLDAKIYRGRKAKPGEFPWIVAFADADRPEQVVCGGSLVAPGWALTAAHCRLRPSEDVAYVGGTTLAEDHNKPLKIDAFCGHPAGLDLALTHLTRDATETAIALAHGAQPDFVGMDMTILGWGLTESGTRSSHLLYTAVPVLAQSRCEAELARIVAICPGCFCGKRQGSIADACTWDSGGPGIVVAPGGTGFTQVGVISRGAGCGVKPGLYQFVPSETAWIEATVNAAPSARKCAQEGI